MKRISILLATMMTAALVTACGGNTGGTAPTTTAASTTSTSADNSAANPGSEENTQSAGAETSGQDSTSSDSKILIAYFTRSDNVDQVPGVDAVSRASFNVDGEEVYGNTELLARYINEATGGELFSILTEDPYPYDVDDTIQQIDDEGDHRTQLTTHVENMDDYDVVFIGFPVWYATMPEPVISFLNEYDFSGKTVVPFSTHRGSRFGSSINDLKDLLPDSTILDGFTVDGDSAISAQDDVENWLGQINFME